jgi:hypothetical protein
MTRLPASYDALEAGDEASGEAGEQAHPDDDEDAPQQVRRDAAARRRPDTLPEPFVPFGTQLAHFVLLCASL